MKTATYLPLFTGFYGTIWEADETSEIEHINELREEKGLEPANFDDFTFDYRSYELQVVKGIANYLENELKQYVSSIEVERVVSPKEYNFRNDSADVIIELSDANIDAIRRVLIQHKGMFKQYLQGHYTSCSGFISHYPNNIDGFVGELEIGPDLVNALSDAHKLGSILNFICENEDITELGAYDRVEKYIEVSNYDELLPE
jgi:hypothetical protein